MGRALREGAGLVKGASGRVVEVSSTARLHTYPGLMVGNFTVLDGLNTPSNMPRLLNSEFLEVTDDLVLAVNQKPAILVEGQIIHYETDTVIDKAIGPLSEIIVRATLKDSSNGQILGQAHLIGRSKALTSSGRHNLAKGAARALRKWLKDHGVPERDTEE